MYRPLDTEMITARFISFITNPLAVLLAAFIFGNFSIVSNSPEVAVIFFSIGSFFPVILYIHYLWIHKKNLLEYASIPREKRNNLLISAVISFSLVVLMFIYTGVSNFWVYSGMLFVILFAVFYLLNRFIDKASFHAGMFAFSVLYLTNRVSVAFALALILIPFIGWSRVYLHKHSWFQLMLGIVVGMFLALLSWTF